MLKILQSLLIIFISATALVLWLTAGSFYTTILRWSGASTPELVPYALSLIVEIAKALFLHYAIYELIAGRVRLGALIPAISFFLLSVLAHSGNTDRPAPVPAALERPSFEQPKLDGTATVTTKGSIEQQAYAAAQAAKANAQIAKSNEAKLAAAKEKYAADLEKFQADSTAQAAAAVLLMEAEERKSKYVFYTFLALEALSALFVYCLADLGSGGPIRQAIKRRNPEPQPEPQPEPKRGLEVVNLGDKQDEQVEKLKALLYAYRSKARNLKTEKAREAAAWKALEVEEKLEALGAEIPQSRSAD